MLKREGSSSLSVLRRQKLIYKMAGKKELLEFILDDEQIDDLIDQLQELKENKMQVHYDLQSGQINHLDGGISICEFLIHHEDGAE